jgi:hypothetical protein
MKWLEHKTDHFLHSSTEEKNACIFSPIQFYAIMAQTLKSVTTTKEETEI